MLNLYLSHSTLSLQDKLMSLMRIKTEVGKGKDREGRRKGGKKEGEAIGCGFAQPLAMTNWSNYA